MYSRRIGKRDGDRKGVGAEWSNNIPRETRGRRDSGCDEETKKIYMYIYTYTNTLWHTLVVIHTFVNVIARVRVFRREGVLPLSASERARKRVYVYLYVSMWYWWRGSESETRAF